MPFSGRAAPLHTVLLTRLWWRVSPTDFPTPIYCFSFDVTQNYDTKDNIHFFEATSILSSFLISVEILRFTVENTVEKNTHLRLQAVTLRNGMYWGCLYWVAVAWTCFCLNLYIYWDCQSDSSASLLPIHLFTCHNIFFLFLALADMGSN